MLLISHCKCKAFATVAFTLRIYAILYLTAKKAPNRTTMCSIRGLFVAEMERFELSNPYESPYNNGKSISCFSFYINLLSFAL
jgi:hypothetical protein